MREGRTLLRTLCSGAVIIGGIFTLSACDKPLPTAVEFEKLCRAEAYIKVLDSVLWKKYVQLATENSPRADRRPGLVEMDDYTISYGPSQTPRSRGRKSADIGIHDDQIYISYSGIDVAIIFDKVMIWGGFGGYSALTCSVRALDQYPVRVVS
jgi:hypothetical protein